MNGWTSTPIEAGLVHAAAPAARSGQEALPCRRGRGQFGYMPGRFRANIGVIGSSLPAGSGKSFQPVIIFARL